LMSKRDGCKKVLFVCIGNACRSPMAEAIACLDAPDAIDAFSAGLMPIGFVPELTKQTLMKNGYWVEGLESKGISPGVWERVDVVINMSGRPKKEAFREPSKVVDWEIEDPFERGPEDYQRVFDKIRARVGKLAEEYRREYAANRIAERRSRPRLYATSPMFISPNGWNNARVVNVSEDGLALSSDVPLPSRPLQNLRIQFPGPPRPLEARCQIVWKSSNNKQAGIQFVGLTAEARRFIRAWISAQAVCVGFQSQIERTREEQNLRLELPNPTGPGTAALAPSDGPEGFQEVAARTSRGTWREFAALAVLTVVSTFVLHSLATHPAAQSAATTDIRRGTAASNAPAKPTPPSPPTTPGTSDSAPEKTEAPPPIVDSPSPEKADDLRHDSSKGSSFTAAAQPAEKPSHGILLKAARGSLHNTPELGRPTNQTARFTASVNSRPLKKPKLEAAASPLPVPPPLEVKMPQAANLAPTRPADARSDEPEDKASARTLVKQPVTAAQMTGEISVLTDPYPSLRADERGSKKQKHGASLELGHLLSRVVPVYPEEAKRQGIQGTVKLHAVVDRYGSVKSMQPLSGPAILGAAVVNAVRQWQYTETKLAGQPVETEVDVAVVFRLSNSATPKS
jgi:arsenate reductase (thioredoxin)